MKLSIETPRWALPLLGKKRYKGAKGGRGSGKSHFFAELLVEGMIRDPDLCVVCIREIQKSLKFSAKKLIEGKIRALGVSHLFDITLTEIRRVDGAGVCIFQGMQDHTADSIKSLEGFGVAWCEEAQSLTARSIELLLPTIRADGSEIWFSWNPDQDTDAVDRLMCVSGDIDIICVHVNYTDNPFCPDTLIAEAEKHKLRDPDTFGHVWLGEYRDYSESQIFAGKWEVAEFEPQNDWEGPYHGLDFGFAKDPTAAVKCWIYDNQLMIERESGGVGVDLDDTADMLERDIPEICKHVVRADCARPESISYLKKDKQKSPNEPKPLSIPRIESCVKWSGSVEDGIEHIKSYDRILIHPRCVSMIEEARKYSYKVDKNTGDVLPVVVDDFNHYWDAVRYAIGPMIRQNKNTAGTW